MLRVAIDVTPLIGRRTGIGTLVAGAVESLADRPGLALRPFAVSWRGRTSVSAQRAPMPARILRAAWLRSGHPCVDWWTGRVDVVHGTNYVVPPSRGRAEVVSVHDLTFLHYPEMCTPDTRQYPELVRRAVRRGAFVHTDSQFVADEVREWLGLSADRVRAIYPGVAPVSGGPVVPSGPVVPGVPGAYLLALGTIEPRKDLPTLVAAFAALASDQPDLSLVIAGPDGWGLTGLDAAIAALSPSVQSRIVRTGWVDDDLRAALVQHCAVFVYPSLYEGFGFPPIEAMQRGVPVVATTAGSVPEIVGDAALLVPARDAPALAEAITVALQPAQRSRLVELGYARVAQFSWSAFADEMNGLYRQVHENARGTRR